MNYDELKANYDSETVRDKMVIQKSIKQLFALPLEALYKDGYNVNGEPMREARLNEIALRLGFKARDKLPDTFGGLIDHITSKKKADPIVLSDIALMHFGYLPKPER